VKLKWHKNKEEPHINLLLQVGRQEILPEIILDRDMQPTPIMINILEHM
jgi:hypothetical protein